MVSEEFEAGNEKEVILRTDTLLGKDSASFERNLCARGNNSVTVRGLVIVVEVHATAGEVALGCAAPGTTTGGSPVVLLTDRAWVP